MQIDERIAELTASDGYTVVSRDAQLVVLERKNSWFGVVLSAALSGFGGGGAAITRKQRVYLEVDERGEATVRATPPRHAEAEH